MKCSECRDWSCARGGGRWEAVIEVPAVLEAGFIEQWKCYFITSCSIPEVFHQYRSGHFPLGIRPARDVKHSRGFPPLPCIVVERNSMINYVRYISRAKIAVWKIQIFHGASIRNWRDRLPDWSSHLWQWYTFIGSASCGVNTWRAAWCDNVMKSSWSIVTYEGFYVICNECTWSRNARSLRWDTIQCA